MSAVDCPIHISKSPVITGEGNGFTTTFKLAVEEHPSELVTVTEYRVVSAGAEIIDEAVAPVDHKYVAPPEAVKTVVPPTQMLALPLMLAIGKGKTVIPISSVDVHPLQSVTVTV